MTDREERRFAEVSRDSIKLMAESTGVDLADDVAALLAEDVCYRLREAAQTSSQFMRHAKRRKLTVEDLNRALRWSNVEAVCGYGAQDVLPFRSVKEGELFFVEDREINLIELALATNIPKGCAETMVRVNVAYLDGKGNVEPQGTVPTAVQTLSDDLLKYYQQVTRAILGEDPHLMKMALLDLQSNSKIAALLPYFVYVISGVKSVSHDLEQLNRLLHMVKSLVQNPYLYLGSYVRSLVSSVMYCILEPLAASINPLNDHWTLRDYAALLLSHIFWCENFQYFIHDSVFKVAVERLLKMKALSLSQSAEGGANAQPGSVAGSMGYRVSSPGLSPPSEPLSETVLGIASHLQAGGAGCPWEEWSPVPLPAMYSELYSFFGDSLAVRFSTGPGFGSYPPCAPACFREARKEPLGPVANPDTARKMPQLTANLNISPRQDGSPRTDPPPPSLAATGAGRSLARSSSVQRSRSSSSRSGQRSAGLSRDVFPKARFISSQSGPPAFSFVIGGRQMGRRCQGRRPFQTTFASTSSVPANPPRAYAHKLPVIGRVGKPVRRWTSSHYSLYLPL
ncbi:hypothetical protein GOODEAATRI_011353 [Goodea atripinnis]|uniref:TATA box binding protein associated factor (TAF) histone-like fold domain-containing protein n=1 Tax=Goodea atripinnis TaxID=208336 RepID=A0ABV0PD83_9TELE